MSIYFGNDTVNDLYVGLTPVTKGYVGTHLFYNGDNTIIDITYEKYIFNTQFSTLYNTAKKPVKSAILKGNTFVSMCDDGVADASDITRFTHNFTSKGGTFEQVSDGIKATATADGTYLVVGYDVRSQQRQTMTIGKKYYGVADVTIHNLTNSDSCKIIFRSQHALYESTSLTNGRGLVQLIFTIDGIELNLGWLGVGTNGENAVTGDSFTLHSMSVYEITEEEINLSYEELANKYPVKCVGMQSVKMPVLKTTGKNLFPTNNFLEYGTDNKMVGQDTFEVYLKSGDYCSSYVHADDSDKDTMMRYKLLDEQDNEVLGNSSVDRTFTIENNGLYKLRFGRGSIYSGKYTKIQVQLEEGSVATEHESFKSNILTVNEDIELRGIGEVKDELNLLTGELTQRFEEIVLDGSESWTQAGSQSSGFARFYTSAKIKKAPIAKVISPNFPCYNGSATNYGVNGTENVTGISANNFFNINIRMDRIGVTDLTNKTENVALLKQWLSNNPLTMQYELETESIKTVDLSIVDQDGNDTELSTFNDLTHVTLSSEGLIPEAELEVYTKNEEDLEDSSNYVVHTLSGEYNTLYFTEEKPVKSAILKGNALVNHKKDNVVISPELSNCYDYTLSGCKNNTNYLIKFSAEHDEDVMVGFLIDPSAWSTASTELKWAKPGNITVIINSGSTPNYLRIRAKSCENLMIIEYQDGMENCYIPYFEGTQSVKMPVLTTTGKNLFDKTKITANKLIIGGGVEMTSTGSACTDYIPVEAGKTYIRNGGGATIAVYDTDKNFIERTGGTATFTATANGYIRWNINSYASVIDTMQIEEGTTTTTYEPYKTNILTVNEDVTLRSNGDVYDELNLLTGRLTQRIDENNEVLAQEVVKTVDLSVVNQDGNDTELKTFNDITHVTISSEGLIPEAELEVAEKVTEVAMSMRAISREQEVINTTANEQSENVDTTMIATTDIYEQLL